jgi:hypothetical protein
MRRRHRSRAVRTPEREEPVQSVEFWHTLARPWRRRALSIAALTYVAIPPTPRALMATLGNASGLPNFVAAIGSNGNEVIVVPARLDHGPGRYGIVFIPSGDKPHRWA